MSCIFGDFESRRGGTGQKLMRYSGWARGRKLFSREKRGRRGAETFSRKKLEGEDIGFQEKNGGEDFVHWRVVVFIAVFSI